jgi:hypothetical protein
MPVPRGHHAKLPEALHPVNGNRAKFRRVPDATYVFEAILASSHWSMDCTVWWWRPTMLIKKMIPVACLTAVLGFSLPSTAQVTDAVKHAGQATVDTGKKAVTATEQAGKKVGTETKKAVTGAPKGTTGQCKDGTYTKATMHSGACSKHGGVRRWF